MKVLTRAPCWALALLLTTWSCGESELPAMDLAIAFAEEAEGRASMVRRARSAAPTRPLAEGATLETSQDIGLARPVAALHDPAADVYLISNAGRDGAPGFITSLLPDGSVEATRWIDGAADGVTLNSPAGMALIQSRRPGGRSLWSGSRLVIADGDHLRVFDRETGAPRGAVRIEGAIALKDVAVGTRGDVYVSDSGVGPTRRAPYGAVYRVSRRGTVSVVAKSSILGRPTGLVMVGSTAWIAGIEPRKFYGVDENGTLTHGATLPAAGGDAHFAGLTWNGERVFFSSPATRTVYAGPLQGPFEPIVMQIDSPGDVGWDAARRRLLVPRADTDRLEIHTLPSPPPT